MRQGMIHIYCGDGKGKTTAATGLAVRAAGSGMKVLFARFLKNENSAELCVLDQIPGIEVIHLPKSYGFYNTQSEEEKFEQVKSALQDIQVNGVTISQVMGYGTQRGYTEIVRGSEVDILLHPKIKFEVVVSSEEWEQKTISAIQKAAFTGEVGDGKIFSYEIRSAVKIRTKETGYNAVQSQDNL